MRTRFALLAAAVALAVAAPASAADLKKGTPEIKSVSALAFGPNGMLFIGDPESATISAIDTGDTKPDGGKATSTSRNSARRSGRRSGDRQGQRRRQRREGEPGVRQHLPGRHPRPRQGRQPGDREDDAGRQGVESSS